MASVGWNCAIASNKKKMVKFLGFYIKGDMGAQKV